MQSLACISDESIQVELYLACCNLLNMDIFSKSDPQVWLYQKENNKWVLKGKTETIQDNLNPTFTQTFILSYFFESHQYLKFEVVDIDGPNEYEFIGSVEIELGKIVGARDQMVILDLKAKSGNYAGKLKCRCENMQENLEEYNIQWKGINFINTDRGFFNLRWFDKTDPFLRIMRKIDDGTPNGGWLKVHETEVIPDNLNPIWHPFDMASNKLTTNDIHRKLKIECWDWEDNADFQYVGEFEFTMNDIINLEKRKFDLYNSTMKKITGALELIKFNVQKSYTFLDYLKSGVQLNVIVAIDFTGSNGTPKSPQSLHAIKPQEDNQYQQAIRAVCDILLNYDHDQLVSVYGFGAKPRLPNLNTNQTLHCFPLTGDSNKNEVYQTKGIMDIYKSVLPHLEFSGPTYFTPIFQEAIKIAKDHKEKDTGIYTILLVLTDGEIHDMSSTIDCIFDMAYLPISIIIIGVGNEDFENMKTLDGDDGLFNSAGKKVPRDLVQFVPFRNFKDSIDGLSKEVLAEIPNQLVDYMKLNGIKPKILNDSCQSKDGINKLSIGMQDNKKFIEDITTNVQGMQAQNVPIEPSSNLRLDDADDQKLCTFDMTTSQTVIYQKDLSQKN